MQMFRQIHPEVHQQPLQMEVLGHHPRLERRHRNLVNVVGLVGMGQQCVNLEVRALFQVNFILNACKLVIQKWNLFAHQKI